MKEFKKNMTIPRGGFRMDGINNRNIEFDSIQVDVPDGNNFDLTHSVHSTGRMGNMIPVEVIECFPGDKMNIQMSLNGQFAPLISPIMHRVDAFAHTWFVPHRLVWDNWQKFITNKSTGGVPYINIDGNLTPAEEKFLDYFGVPPFSAGAGATTKVNAFAFAAYQLIYNEFYRSQQLSSEVDYALVDGNNTANKDDLLTMRKRCFEHDYFTSCLPTPQASNPVAVPIGEIKLMDDWNSVGGSVPNFKDDNLAAVGGNPVLVDGSVPPEIEVGGIKPLAYDPDGSLSSTGTINDLRSAFAIQKWLERLMRAGSRYIEYIKVNFGITPSDATLQRPQYVTGMKVPVMVDQVLATAETATLPQGNKSGNAYMNGYSDGDYFECEEHGTMITILSFVPRTTYSQGIPRHFLRREPLDFPLPQFAHIGEQAVTLEELYAYDNNSGDTFGYIPRFSELKSIPNRISGEFRTTLNFWLLNRTFAAAPQLNEEFVEVDGDDFEDIFAVMETDDNIWFQMVFGIRANRKIPYYSTPI